MLGDTLDGDRFLEAAEVRIKNYQADSGGYRCFTDSLPQFLPLLSFFLLSAPLVCATCEILKHEMQACLLVL